VLFRKKHSKIKETAQKRKHSRKSPIFIEIKIETEEGY